MELSGTNVVVTGGSGDLGSVVVDAFLRMGARVSVPVRSGNSRLPKEVFSAACNLAKEDEVNRFFTLVHQQVGPTEILICLAGGFVGGSLVEETSDDQLIDQFQMNFLSAHHAVKEVLGGMKARRNGRIVTIAAQPVISPAARREAYAVSKGAVVTMTQTVAQEVRGTGVTCNAIAPSIIRTPSNIAGMPNQDSSGWVPPEEIAALIIFLCSREAASINGNVIKIFGGH